LDGYTLSDVINLIDRSGPAKAINKNSTKTIIDVSNSTEGDSIYFFDRFNPAFNYLEENEWNSILDINFQVLKEQNNVFLYLGVGHGPMPFQRLDYEFVKGSACIMEMCSSSFTFDFDSKEPNDLLLGDLIADGCTAGFGNVDYIFFGNIMSPEIFVESYLNPTENYNLAESFYMAGRTLSWQKVVIGDPKSSVFIDNTAELSNENSAFFQIFPNPFLEKITLKSSENLNSIKIIDLNGVIVFDFLDLQSNEESIDLSSLKKGTYLIQVISENKVFQKMILKQN